MIAQDTLAAAYEICQQSGLKEDNPRVLPIRLGVEYKGKQLCVRIASAYTALSAQRLQRCYAKWIEIA
jgi:hypothetical protein